MKTRRALVGALVVVSLLGWLASVVAVAQSRGERHHASITGSYGAPPAPSSEAPSSARWKIALSSPSVR